ncbi:hypothetical protein JD844_018317 [Phrynosoma platyrhinos]|uniref:Fanconi Anaemia group E protein C-terminal domain-containing protein n=1 Tax=Phrynosoma platyrhinos TaxID=52577 RepID=A0ABQ7SNB1_PHRPL|nr:hypothetical protein JD844_018317 [Phrynosoma platyrhinos]
MDKPWLQRCDKTSRLLLCTLMSGPCGALAAFRTLQRSQSAEEGRQGFNWQIFTEYLCSQEPVLKGPEKTLILLDSSPDLWVQRMRDLLQMGLEEKSSSTPGLLSSVCEQKLKNLCQKEVGGPRAGNELMMEVSGNEDVHSPSDSVCQSAPMENAIERGGGNQTPPQDAAAMVPDHIKVHVTKLKEQLQLQFDHSDGTAPPELQILNECTPSQILLLTEPASWALTTALMRFCSKYARPVCCTLISSIVQAPEKGHEQIKVVCKLIEECLEPEYVRLVFSHIIEVLWSEDVLTIVHSLLGRQVELSTEFFNILVLNLCQMAQEFATSMHYAKLILTLLTKYQKSITLAHHHRLSCALELNKTMLKKSLQVALKRVTSG